MELTSSEGPTDESGLGAAPSQAKEGAKPEAEALFVGVCGRVWGGAGELALVWLMCAEKLVRGLS